MAQRKSSAQRGYNWRWQKCRKIKLQREPLCRMCLDHGRITEATVVDHIIPHKGDPELFWDENNWASLCADCHNSSKQSQEKRGYSSDVGMNGWPLDDNHPANRRS